MSAPALKTLALKTLFEQHHLGVFRFLTRMTGNRSEAEEMTQEVFLKAAKQGRRLGAGPISVPWLYTVARNLVIDRSRRRASRPEPVALELTPERSRRPSQHLSVALREALAGLQEEERVAFLLRESGGLSYEEIAAVEGTTADAIRNRIYRARKTLRGVLAGSHPARGHWKERIS